MAGEYSRSPASDQCRPHVCHARPGAGRKFPRLFATTRSPSSTAIGGSWVAKYDAHCTDVVADYNLDTQEVYSSRLRALNLRWLS